MLNENIKTIRKAKGFSQEELAVKLKVVRQTISKWESGLSVPDSDMLLSLSEVLETPVSVLLGEKVTATEVNDLKAICEKLEVINLQLAEQKLSKRKHLHWLFLIASAVIVILFVSLIVFDSQYLNWDYQNPELTLVGTVCHAFEFVFIRMAPIALIGTVIGAVLTKNSK